jgi:MFS family permease
VQTSAYPHSAGGEYIATDAAIDRDDRNRRIKAIVGASSGNLVEWYDFYAYAFTSIYFASAFFPAGDSTSQLMATAGIFVVGFFMRPLGGWLFCRHTPPLGRQRVWDGGHLRERGRGPEQSRILHLLTVCDADRRAMRTGSAGTLQR